MAHLPLWHLAHLPHQTQKQKFIRCSKFQKLCNTTIVSSQIWDSTDRNGIHFYSFLFSFLSPLSSLFLFSSLSPVPSLFSLYRLLSLYSSFRIFDQSEMFTGSNYSIAPTTTTRFVGKGLEDSFLEMCKLEVVCLRNSLVPSLLPLFLSPIPFNLSHPLKLPPPISPNRRQYCSAALDLTNLTHGPISPRGRCWSHPLPSPLCLPFTLPLSGCGVFIFYFFCCNLGWSNIGE